MLVSTERRPDEDAEQLLATLLHSDTRIVPDGACARLFLHILGRH